MIEKMSVVDGPCEGCGEARECCSGIKASLTPGQVEFHQGNFPENVMVLAGGIGAYLEFEGECGYYDEEIGGCSIRYRPERSIDCKRYPLDNDGDLMERDECPNWDEFERKPANCIAVNEAGMIVAV